MCVEFTSDWYKTKENVYALKIVRVEEDRGKKIFKSLFDPDKRTRQNGQKGDNVVYKLQIYHVDKGDYGFYLYPMNYSLRQTIDKYKYIGGYCTLLVRIPLGTLIREGVDINNNKTINAKTIYTVAVLRNE